jgi:5-methylcytosine-specific restriction enzyme A
MPTYLLTWNPRRWAWKDFDEEYESLRTEGFLDDSWNFHLNRRRVKEGDRVFVLRQGVDPKGVVASGYVTSEAYKDVHFSDRRKMAWYVDVRFDVMLKPIGEILPRSSLEHGILAGVYWDIQGSGMSLDPEASSELEERWTAHLESLGMRPHMELEEAVGEGHYWEGTLRRVRVNAYERDPRARAACIAHYGSACSICGFDFGEAYGDPAKGIIHVHHLRQLSKIGKGYRVDPIADLRPVCPNCHAVIHSRSIALTIDEVKNLRKG